VETSLLVSNPRLIVTTAPGLEKLLEDELKRLLPAACDIKSEAKGALTVTGPLWETLAPLLLESRLASRVLLSLRNFAARNAAMLYDQVRRIAWAEFVDGAKTLAVFAHGNPQDSDMTLSFAPLKIKDAICDEVKKQGKERPDISRTDPDVRVEAFLHSGRCEISVDLVGLPLHRRGYRHDSREAPLRENRAAGLLMFAGYDGTQALTDPFCGSGTIAIEAALMALKRPPGLVRPLSSLAIWKIFPECRPHLDRHRTQLEKAALKDTPAPIVASDISKKNVHAARENAERAGVEHAIRFEVRDARELKRPGLIVSNPPFGDRTGESPAKAAELLGEFTRQVKHFCAPATMAFILPKGPLEHAVGMKPSKRMEVENGPMDARYSVFEVYAGRKSL
jgi:putative N6-adenine-specific DNA methylase